MKKKFEFLRPHPFPKLTSADVKRGETSKDLDPLGRK